MSTWTAAETEIETEAGAGGEVVGATDKCRLVAVVSVSAPLPHSGA